MHQFRPLAFPFRHGLLVAGCVAACQWSSPVLAACTDDAGASTRTCVSPLVDQPEASAPGLHTFILDGTAAPGLQAPDGARLTNFGGPQDLTLTTVGTVEVTAAAPVDNLLGILNFDGLGTVTVGAGTTLTADDVAVPSSTDPWGAVANIVMGNSSGIVGESLTLFEGTILLDAPTRASLHGVVTYVDVDVASTARSVIGSSAIVNVRGSAGAPTDDGVRGVGAYSFYHIDNGADPEAQLVLEAGSVVNVTGAAARGAAVESTYDSYLEHAGHVTVTGAGGYQALAGLYAITRETGHAQVVMTGGSVTVVQASPDDAGPSYGIYAGPEKPADEEDAAQATVVVLDGEIRGGGAGFTGIRAEAIGDRDALVWVDSGVSIDILQGDGAQGVHASSQSGNVFIGVDGSLELLSGTTGGAAVLAETVTGEIHITNLGRIATSGADAPGVRAVAAVGSDQIEIEAGDTLTSGERSHAVQVLSPLGNVLVRPLGDLSTGGDGAEGVSIDHAVGYTEIRGGTASITPAGADAAAIHVVTGLGMVDVDVSGATLSTVGEGSHGLWIETTDADTQATFGAVSVAGTGARGVLLDTNRANLTATGLGPVTAGGDESAGVWAYSYEDAGPDRSNIGLDLRAAVSAEGRDSVAVLARSRYTGVTVDIAATGSLLGGWSPAGGAPSPLTESTGAGLVVGAATDFRAVVNNAGFLGAWSDRALLNYEATAPFGTGAVEVNNTGRITGVVTLGPSADVFSNLSGGVLEARLFADEDGDGVRDTRRVATLDFGAGDDVFLNEAGATLRLGSVQAANVDATGQYLPDLVPVASHTTINDFVEQAHLVQLERFENRGLISLRDTDAGGASPVAGDVLLMTSGTVAPTGALIPGAAPMVFLADGGTLALDVELNAGGAQSRSDMLVVDSVQLGPNGPTQVLVSNANGMGAPTQGDGIKIVDVLGGAELSAAGAFTLGAPVVAGAFTYNLFRSGVLVDDGDWYLRTEPVTPPPPPSVDPPPPVDPEQPPPPPPPPPVTYRPEAALFAALPEFMRNVDASAPGSRQARLGDEAGGLTTARRGRAWGRYIRQDIDTAQQGTVAPSSVGEVRGFQFGVELFGGQDEAAAQIGLYAGRLTAEAVISGFSNGVENTPVGRLEPEVTYAGVYVSRHRGRGLYFDAVLQYGHYTGEALTYADGEVARIRGTGGYASLEAGYGFQVARRFLVEPQFQVIAQPQKLSDVTIVNARVSHKPANTVAGRAGLRLKGDLGAGAWRVQPYVSASVWRGLDHQDQTRFSGNGVVQTTLLTDSELDAIEIAGGLSVGMGSRLTAFAQYSRLDSRGDAGLRHEGKAISGGLRLAW